MGGLSGFTSSEVTTRDVPIQETEADQQSAFMVGGVVQQGLFDETYPINNSIKIQIKDANDDSEEFVSSGVMYLDSSDLELGADPQKGEQIVGLRFTNVDVPFLAKINSAYIEFVTDEVSSGATEMSISAQASDDSESFSETINDISDRPETSTLSWTISAWNTEDETHQTPDLKSIIEDVVEREGWMEGNAMAFFIEGTGARTAESYDGEPESAAVLHIDYTYDPTTDDFKKVLMEHFPDSDFDGDGLTNIEEKWWCTNPTEENTDGSFDDDYTDIKNRIQPWNGIPDGCKNADQDGLPDEAELNLIGTVIPPAENAWSTDGDNYSDGDEFFKILIDQDLQSVKLHPFVPSVPKIEVEITDVELIVPRDIDWIERTDTGSVVSTNNYNEYSDTTQINAHAGLELQLKNCFNPLNIGGINPFKDTCSDRGFSATLYGGTRFDFTHAYNTGERTDRIVTTSANTIKEINTDFKNSYLKNKVTIHNTGNQKVDGISKLTLKYYAGDKEIASHDFLRFYTTASGETSSISPNDSISPTITTHETPLESDEVYDIVINNTPIHVEIDELEYGDDDNLVDNVNTYNLQLILPYRNPDSEYLDEKVHYLHLNGTETFESVASKLNIPHTFDSNGHLTQINGLREDTSDSSPEHSVLLFQLRSANSHQFSLNLRDLQLSNGDSIEIKFGKDSDGDGLANTYEIFETKTDPGKPDTDGDTLWDGEFSIINGKKVRGELAIPCPAYTKWSDKGLSGSYSGLKHYDPRLRDTDGDMKLDNGSPVLSSSSTPMQVGTDFYEHSRMQQVQRDNDDEKQPRYDVWINPCEADGPTPTPKAPEPIHSDNDGFNDALDKCPNHGNTSEETVLPNGCLPSNAATNQFGHSIILNQNNGTTIFAFNKVNKLYEISQYGANSKDWYDWKSQDATPLDFEIFKNENGDLTLFEANTEYLSYMKTKSEGKWSKWTPLKGSTSDIEIGIGNDGNTILFENPKIKGEINYRKQGSSDWTPWKQLGTDAKDLEIGQQLDGRLVVCKIAKSDNSVWCLTQKSNGNWGTDWQNAGGSVKDLEIARDITGRLVLFAVDKNTDTIFTNYQDGGLNSEKWGTKWNILSRSSTEVELGHTSDGRLTFCKISPKDEVWCRTQATADRLHLGGWDDWVHTGGTNAKEIMLGQNSKGCLVLVHTNIAQSAIFVKEHTDSTCNKWGNWTTLEGRIKGLGSD